MGLESVFLRVRPIVLSLARSTMPSSTTLISNSRKVPAGRVPSEAYANAITSFLLTVKNGRNSWRWPLLAAQYRLEASSTSCLRTR